MFFFALQKRTSERSEIRSDVERVKGIEPSYPAWKAGVLPLNYTRVCPVIVAFPGGNVNLSEGAAAAHFLPW